MHFCGSECSKNSEHLAVSRLKFVYNDFTSTYTELLNVSGISYLYHQQIRLLALEIISCEMNKDQSIDTAWSPGKIIR